MDTKITSFMPLVMTFLNIVFWFVLLFLRLKHVWSKWATVYSYNTFCSSSSSSALIIWIKRRYRPFFGMHALHCFIHCSGALHRDLNATVRLDYSLHGLLFNPSWRRLKFMRAAISLHNNTPRTHGWAHGLNTIGTQ